MENLQDFKNRCFLLHGRMGSSQKSQSSLRHQGLSPRIVYEGMRSVIHGIGLPTLDLQIRTNGLPEDHARPAKLAF
jgi:hypothetical protein